jgi:hypothetical protein
VRVAGYVRFALIVLLSSSMLGCGLTVGCCPSPFFRSGLEHSHQGLARLDGGQHGCSSPLGNSFAACCTSVPAAAPALAVKLAGVPATLKFAADIRAYTRASLPEPVRDIQGPNASPPVLRI